MKREVWVHCESGGETVGDFRVVTELCASSLLGTFLVALGRAVEDSGLREEFEEEQVLKRLEARGALPSQEDAAEAGRAPCGPDGKCNTVLHLTTDPDFAKPHTPPGPTAGGPTSPLRTASGAGTGPSPIPGAPPAPPPAGGRPLFEREPARQVVEPPPVWAADEPAKQGE